MKIRVVRSDRRKKSIEAKVKGNYIVIYIPSTLSRKEEKYYVDRMVKKMEKKKLGHKINGDHYLLDRFHELNKKYFQGNLSITSIRFVLNQNKKYGSCTPAKGTIRISSRLRKMPEWVLEYVIMHEMTHLIHHNHSKAFWKKLTEYPYAERARGFLMAKEMDEGSVDGSEE